MLAQPTREIVKLSRSITKNPAWVWEIQKPLDTPKELPNVANWEIQKAFHTSGKFPDTADSTFQEVFQMVKAMDDQDAKETANKLITDLISQLGKLLGVTAPEVSWPMYEDEKIYIWLETEQGLVLIRLRSEYRPTAVYLHATLLKAIAI